MSATITDLGLPPLPYAQMSNIIGLGLWEAIQTLFPGSDETFVREFTTRYRHHFLAQERAPSRLFPGAYATLSHLHEAGFWMAVATGKGRQGLNKALTQTDCGQFFHATRCADETASKPNPEMVLDILDVLGIEPDSALMIGDTEYDMQMARNAATHALAVSYGVHEVERLMQHQPLGCLDDIRNLPAWLTENGYAAGC